MRQKANLTALCILFMLTFGRSQEAIRRASEQVPLTKSENGVDGWLRIVMSQAGNKVGPAKPPQNARLQILDLQGQVIADQDLERPLAKVTQERLDKGATAFLVTVDYSIGWGSYAGLTTLPLKITDGKFGWLTAINADSHKEEPIRFSKTPKSDWKFVPFAGNQDILTVHCHPDFASGFKHGDEFVVEYARYRVKDGKWIKYALEQKGYWESDQPFPPMNQFRDK